MMLWRYSEAPRLLAERLSLPALQGLVGGAGVHEALRLTCCYADPTKPDHCATLLRLRGETCPLMVVYDHTSYAGQSFAYTFQVPSARYLQVLACLRGAGFDTLDDDPDLSPESAPLWRVERAGGRFYHDVLLSPASARGHHRELVMGLRQHLPEALRELTL
jgi:hypothetical protein